MSKYKANEITSKTTTYRIPLRDFMALLGLPDDEYPKEIYHHPVSGTGVDPLLIVVEIVKIFQKGGN